MSTKAKFWRDVYFRTGEENAYKSMMLAIDEERKEKGKRDIGSFELQGLELFGQRLWVGMIHMPDAGTVAVVLFVNGRRFKTLFFRISYSESRRIK